MFRKNILELKCKYGYILVKYLWDQKSLNEYIKSNLERISKTFLDENSIFKAKHGIIIIIIYI